MGDVLNAMQMPVMAPSAMPVAPALLGAEGSVQTGSLFEAVMQEAEMANDAKDPSSEDISAPYPLGTAVLPRPASDPLISVLSAEFAQTGEGQAQWQAPSAILDDASAKLDLPEGEEAQNISVENHVRSVNQASMDPTISTDLVAADVHVMPSRQGIVAVESPIPKAEMAVPQSAYDSSWQFKQAQAQLDPNPIGLGLGQPPDEHEMRDAPTHLSEGDSVAMGRAMMAAEVLVATEGDMLAVRTAAQRQDSRAEDMVEPVIVDQSKDAESSLTVAKISSPDGALLPQTDAHFAVNLVHNPATETASLSGVLPIHPHLPRLSAFDLGTHLQSLANRENADRIFLVSDVVAVGDAPTDAVELRLDPEELGRLRISLRPEGDVMQVSVTAERPETLDLLRRHSERLMQELQAAGYEGAKLDFGNWSNGQDQDRKPSTDQVLPDVPIAPLVVTTREARQIHHMGSGLNLRL